MHASDFVMYLKWTEGYPLSSHIKKIAVASVQDIIYITRLISIVSKPISIVVVVVVVVVKKVSSKNVWYKRIEVKKILIQKKFGTKIGFNIVFNFEL